MKLIVISNPTNLNNEHKILCSLFEAGLEHFHLRKPDFSKEETERFLKQIPEEYFKKIVLHSQHDLAEKYNLKGIQFSSKSMELKAGSKYISTSFHSFEEIENCKIKYDYVFLSPIFNSISKQGYHSKFDKKQLINFFSSHSETFDVIALGGINENTIDDALELGFTGVAVLGGIWMSNNPLEKFKLMLDRYQEFNKIKNEQIA